MGPTLNSSKPKLPLKGEKKTQVTSRLAEMSERQTYTYWCHECDMSVILVPTTPTPQPLPCPHCHNDFLEQMDNTTTTTTTTTTITTYDDNLLLEAPFFTRLLHHLTDTSSSPPDNETKTISFIETIPTIKITSSLLEKNPVFLCAICKDQFVVDVEVKQLPCNHLYHCECITPWLNHHNSCPVCRFKIPTETTTTKTRSRSTLRFGDFLVEDDDDDSFGFRSTLSHIARRHGMVLSNAVGDGEARGNDDVDDSVNVMPDVRLLSTSLPADLRI